MLTMALMAVMEMVDQRWSLLRVYQWAHLVNSSSNSTRSTNKLFTLKPNKRPMESIVARIVPHPCQLLHISRITLAKATTSILQTMQVATIQSWANRSMPMPVSTNPQNQMFTPRMAPQWLITKPNRKVVVFIARCSSHRDRQDRYHRWEY